MKQKMLVVMLLCALCVVGRPLTVSAATSGSREDVPPDVALDDSWEDVEKYGFANGMMVSMTLYDGLDEATDVSIDRLDRLHILSATLEPGHFYHVNLDFFCRVDAPDLDKYEDINLQVRFPNTLLQNSPNAIGYSVNGNALDTWCDTFGIDSAEDIDLYYVADSGCMSCLIDGDSFAPGTDDLLFASAEGVPLGQIVDTALDNLMEMDGHQIAFFRVEFTLYAAPHEGEFYYNDIALNHWAGQKLMYVIGTTSAPEAFYYTATLEENGEVTLPESESDSSFTGRSVDVAITVVIALVIIACVVIATILIIIDRRRTTRDGEHLGILDRFVRAMHLDDDDDDYDQ